jgi:hypothetical protein
MTSVLAIESDRGQALTRYAVPIDRPRLYRWIPGDTSTPDHVKVLDHLGGIDGNWIESRCPDAGDDLTDDDVTIDVGGNEWRVLPASTLSDNRTVTLGTTNAAEGDVLEITRLDAEAFTLTVTNGGNAGGDLFVLPASERWCCRAYFDGTDWIVRSAGKLP